MTTNIKHNLPPIIKEVGFDFHWDERKVWQLDEPTIGMPINELTWHFAIPFWSTPGGFYDLKAQDVIEHPDKYVEEYTRALKADTTHPIDVMRWRGRWVILDGLHRLVKQAIEGKKTIQVRKIPQSAIPLIRKPTSTEFTNPNLVAIYDAVNPIGTYTDFYLKLAKSLNAKKVIDLGCGTGLLSHELVKQGHDIIGIEPAPAMLEQAKQKYDNEAQWIVGSTEKLHAGMQADLTIMTGHVAQFFLEDTAWHQALHNIHQALKPGSYLAFESRNPLVQPFTGWPTKENHGLIPITSLGPVEWWSENLKFANGRATYDIHYLFTETGEELVSANELRFRSKEALIQSLKDSGFTVKHVYGDWNSDPSTPESREMIFVARRNH